MEVQGMYEADYYFVVKPFDKFEKGDILVYNWRCPADNWNMTQLIAKGFVKKTKVEALLKVMTTCKQIKLIF